MTEFNPGTERVRARNRIIKDLACQRGLPVNDLFALVENEPGFYVGGDGVHLAASGKSAQAMQVASEVKNFYRHDEFYGEDRRPLLKPLLKRYER